MDFIVHQAFYPVLMVDRASANREMVEQLQNAARAEIKQFRSCRSVGEVVISFKRDLGAKSASDIHAKLRLLHLPVIHDLRDDFEHKARELGFEPDTLLTSPSALFNTGDFPMDQERIGQRAYEIWQSAGQPDGAHDEHWQQACREIEIEDGMTASDPTPATDMTGEDGMPVKAVR